jgi:predicted unusual protein kinase regulating ubiquinone biosynthesis (AarF/ABC1/UbiB family)
VLVERELGAVGELFAEWDDTALASASLGQVHAARLHDGREVAVKVQHPGIEQAVEADLSNAFVIERIVGALGPRAMSSRAMLDELALRFREELDYRLEAERQERFRALFRGNAAIRIPAIVPERSSERVMTSERVGGESLEEVSAAPEARRADYARTLWRFVFESYLCAGELNVDPHPGNYFFQPDGSVVFIDFGCVLPVAPEHLAGARAMHQAAHDRDVDAFRLGVRQVVQSQPGPYEDDLVEYMRRCFAPMLESPFRITRSYVGEIVSGVQDLKMHMFKKKSRFSPLPANTLFVNRLQVGFFSVLARLDVTVDTT